MILPALQLFLGLLVLVYSEDDEEIEADKCRNATMGGTPLDIKVAPWTASVVIKEKAKCSGVIYSMEYIITAAKCVDGFTTKAVRVRVGSSTRSSPDAAVCNIIVHEKFSELNTPYNVALLKLCSPLTASNAIKQIQLVDKFPADNSKVLSTGWPSVRWWSLFWEQCLDGLAQQMMSAEVKMSGRKTCMKNWPKQNQLGRNITDDMFCTEKAGDEACSFDLGSPLALKGKLIGILSRGGCSKRPDVYTNLLKYKTWLAKNSK
ncbi:hypodermin-B [Drosophila elegans]|uniref:hypodermin-B n=1 Tax=Drosophila elegans TaxID=30023 RepID=UPI001BC860D2|nr:hypodermin-B [Drosophila elegans]